MKITLEQRLMLKRYGIKLYEDDVNETLIAISDKIFQIGFLPGDELNLLNKTGLKLKDLYYEIYNQN